MTFRVWAVLDLLAEDRRDEARDAIARATEDGSSPSSAAVALQRYLRRRSGGTGTAPGRDAVPPGDDAVDREARVAGILTEMDRASEALRGGRVDALVRGARSVWPEAAELHPWLGLSAASLLQSAFRFTGDPSLFREAVAACTRVGDGVEAPWMAVYARALLGSLHMMAGGLHAAIDRLEAALDLARETGIEETAPAALSHQFRGYVLWEWNRTDEAEADLRLAWALTGPADGGIRSGVARVLATLTAAAGRVKESDRWLEELETIVREPMTLRNREWLAAVRLMQAVLASRAAGTGTDRERRAGLREVERWRRSWSYDPAEVDGWTDDHLRTRLHELDHALTLLELTRQWAPAHDLAARMVSAVGPYRKGYRIRAGTVLAVALENLGRRDEADLAWAVALGDGAEEGFVRSYLDGSSTRARLHRRALAADATADVARRVSRAAAGWPDAGEETGLTPRQLEVLRTVAAGASNREVAAELDISVPTVKTHLREILARLDATSRTHAVAVARERGLL